VGVEDTEVVKRERDDETTTTTKKPTDQDGGRGRERHGGDRGRQQRERGALKGARRLGAVAAGGLIGLF
jgi:hypothetical protein